jgi:hypothetical protein
MNRIVVVGACGFFGAAVVEALRREGHQVLATSRRSGADLRMDAEDAGAISAVLAAGDVVIDAAGPFQQRSTTLVEACLAIGCDVIDLADSLDYVSNLQQLATRIAAGPGRVLTACSSVSAVSAALVGLTGIDAPVRVSAFLVPATRNTSTHSTALSLFSAIERGVRVLRDGSLVRRHAFSEDRTIELPSPVGPVTAGLAESADAITLPRVWPTLRHVDFWVDTRRSVLNQIFGAAARAPSLLSLVQSLEPVGRPLARLFGARSGGFAVDVEDADGRRVVAGFVHPSHSYFVAVAPAILAARRLAAGTFNATGLVPADRQVDPFELRDWLERAGVVYFTSLQRS